ncbi:hypothetical protein NLM31_01280 [Bradyrhizobium sp. CCGUVB4N]|uniref:hypothetical protein n=1 Tax=Bradyrhizobium sp. CCGUVB4N TaxID=2949631 RepID=UPI0020B37FEF|nr:hypothetical protein [Bradyrhizobium sp. CCGUVB4N]MCP3379071.1 hypothetical protein [Bradyrhizobium sp. CCGUVB4N]
MQLVRRRPGKGITTRNLTTNLSPAKQSPLLSNRTMFQLRGWWHRASSGLDRSTVHGVVFAVLDWSTILLPANEAHVIAIPRCSEIVVVISCVRMEDPSQFLLSATAVHVTRFSPFADVLTFLRLPPRQTPNFASRTIRTK